MNDHDLEKLIRSLKPAPLPEDIRMRLSTGPVRKKRPGNRKVILIAFAAAAAVTMMVGISISLRPEAPTEMSATPQESGPPVSVIKRDSTLLSSRVLSIREYEGELWEVSEEEWRDDTLALYSAGPSQLSATVIRREVVCSPLKFR